MKRTSQSGEDRQAAVDGEWLTLEDAARRLGVSTRTVIRLLDSGELWSGRAGREHRLSRDAVDAYIEACQLNPGSLGHLVD